MSPERLRELELHVGSQPYSVVLELLDHIHQREKWIADLQSGMYINCVYCGHRYGPASNTPESKAVLLKHHIAQCPEHPMSALAKSALGAYHLCESLLAVREGATDELISEIRDGLKQSILQAGLELRP